jgi:hypothetical protein
MSLLEQIERLRTELKDARNDETHLYHYMVSVYSELYEPLNAEQRAEICFFLQNETLAR